MYLCEHVADDPLLVWKRIMDGCEDRVPENLPRIQRAEWARFLQTWNQFHDSRGRECGKALNDLGRRVGIPGIVVSLLNKGTSEERLHAIVAAGHLREISTWRMLRQSLEAHEPDLSIAAARSLLRIDSARGITVVVRQIGRRTDWPYADVSAMLRETGSETISGPLAITALYAQGEDAPRVIAYLNLIDPAIAATTVRHILSSSTDPRVHHACAIVLRNLDCGVPAPCV